jgi:flagellar biosynthesis protein FlhA
MRQRIGNVFAPAVLAIVGILIVPLPPVLLDALLGIDVFGSALVLLMSLRIEDPLEFSAFPPALLLATLFRLALDVSATRLILTRGHEVGGVGTVIPAFGAFVVRGNVLVGLIVFAIVVTIQFIVIASGSQRVAEVCARFTLDAMPGKQMAIDAEVHAGLIDAQGAREKRAHIQKEADFYAAMDGAGKFVKGDAIAALVIVALNLAGGIAIGVIYQGFSPAEAIETYALLSIGNALVTTLPAFLISVAMGMMVTRVAGDGSLGDDLAAQLVARPEVIRTAAALMLGLACVPALPGALFALLGATAFAAATLAERKRREHTGATALRAERAKRAAVRRPEAALGLVGVDALTIELGSGLFALLADPNAEKLLDRIGEVRRALAAEIGLVLPGVRLRDDLVRDPATYGIRVREEVAGEGTLRLDAFLAVADTAVLAVLEGESTREPVYGLAAKWVSPQIRETQREGVLFFDAISILGSHLSEVARSHAASLLGRQEFATLLEHLRASVPALVREIGTDALPIAVVHKAFLALLRERVWPRDPIAALDAIIEASAATREPRELAEAARRTLVPTALRRRGAKVLEPLIVDPAFEADLVRSWSGDVPDAQQTVHIRARIEEYLAGVIRRRAAVVCTAALRPYLGELALRLRLGVDVYAYTELPTEIELRPRAMLGPA